MKHTFSLTVLTLSLAMGSSALHAMEELPFADYGMEEVSAKKEPDITYLAEIITPLENMNNNNVDPEYKVLASLKVFKYRQQYRKQERYYNDDEELSNIAIRQPVVATKSIEKVSVDAVITITCDGCETDRTFDESFQDVPFDVAVLKPFTDDDNKDMDLFMRFTAITQCENKK